MNKPNPAPHDPNAWPLPVFSVDDYHRQQVEQRNALRSVPIRASTWRDYRDGAGFIALLAVIFAACFWFA